jgi:hypothetical protein
VNLKPGIYDLYDAMWDPQGSLNLAQNIIGPDKLGHFADQGYDLFKRAYFDDGKKSSSKSDYKAALKMSNDWEEGMWGISASGVKSFGDMGANYSGMLFYANLISGKDPYLKCDPTSQKYIIIRDFSWADHVNPTWDEGINCSEFQKFGSSGFPYKEKYYKKRYASSDYQNEKPTREQKYSKYLSNIQPPPPLQCPNELETCQNLSQINCARELVSPKCLIKTNPNDKCDYIGLDNVEIPRKSNYSYERKEMNNNNTTESQTHSL